MRPMRRLSRQVRTLSRFVSNSQDKQRPPLIDIAGATFYRHHPSSSSRENSSLFPDLTFTVSSFAHPTQHWAVLSPSASARAGFLEILRSKYICAPPTARTYPYLLTDEIQAKDPHLRNPSKAIQYVGFDAERGNLGGSSMRGAYLSARYEARREETDFSLLDYLKGDTELNPAENPGTAIDEDLLARVVEDLRLQSLVDMAVSNLSNGQTRRARIAKTLMTKPELLLLDGAFMGLDPPTSQLLSSLLNQLAEARAPRILLSLRPQDPIPHWMTHLIYVTDDFEVFAQGPKNDVLVQLRDFGINTSAGYLREDGVPVAAPESVQMESDVAKGAPLIEMRGVKVNYDKHCVLGDWQQEAEGEMKEGLWWTVREGERWGIFGTNGSGKTTLLSLITSDHPQTYSAPIRLFQRSRLPSPGQPGISIFDIQARIGHSSPEVHTFFPRRLSIRRALESAWADAPLSRPTGLTTKDRSKIDACLRWFQAELSPRTLGPDFSLSIKLPAELSLQSMYDREIAKCESLLWADETKFGELSFSAQRVILFLRAIIRNPEIVILDEAFSGMDEKAKEKCALFLSEGENRVVRKSEAKSTERRTVPSLQSQLGLVQLHGLQPNQALLVVSHLKEEVPDCVREWITLPEPRTTAPRIGRLGGPLSQQQGGWSQIWAMDM